MTSTSELAAPGVNEVERPSAVRSGPPDPEPDEVIIRPRSGWIAIDWRELLRAQELLYFLVWRDVKVRYKQTVLGVAWAVLQPLFTMIIFSVIFGRLAGISSGGVPYPVFVFAGLIPWMFFSNGVTGAGLSLHNQLHVVTKIYYPRLLVPTAPVGAILIDMVVSFFIYAIILLAYRIVPSWQIVFLPALLVMTVMATLGLGFALASLTVLYRDVRYTIPFLIQILMFLSPVIYPVTLLPAHYRYVLALNPMFGIIDAYRSSILGTPWSPVTLAISTAATFALFVFGLFYFRKTERLFADIA